MASSLKKQKKTSIIFQILILGNEPTLRGVFDISET